MRIKSVNIIDLIVVITILLIIFLFFTYYLIPKTLRQPSYQIIINDANGLIVGSSVIFGGKDIGRVTRLKFKDNQVVVNFIISNKDFYKIPDGSEITVKSTGLAGSKALEIYYPKNSTHKGVVIKDSYRQIDSDNVQVKMAKLVINSANSVTSTLSYKQLVDIKTFAKNDVPSVTTNIENILNKVVSQIDKVQQDIDKRTLKKINKNLEKNSNANN